MMNSFNENSANVASVFAKCHQRSLTFSPLLCLMLAVRVLNLGWPWKVASFGQNSDLEKLLAGSVGGWYKVQNSYIDCVKL